MAIIAMHSSATALSTLNTKLDVIANNLANVNTPGFKASRVNFQDLMYIERAQPGSENSISQQRPVGLYVGLGVEAAGTQQDFTEGSQVNTGRPLDLMIEGLGFFKVQVEEQFGGGEAFTRAGHFTLNADRELVLANDQGRRLEPVIQIPENATNITIDNNGRVFVIEPGQTQPTEVNQIQLSTFVNPAGLRQIGENLWVETAASGPPLEGAPGEENRGQIRQGALENSNVDPTYELVDLIRTQRAFELNSQVIRAADETLQQVGQLRR